MVLKYFAGPYNCADAAGLVRRIGAGSCYILAAAISLPVAACTVGPDFHTPTAPLARNYLESGIPRSNPIIRTTRTGGPSTMTRHSIGLSISRTNRI